MFGLAWFSMSWAPTTVVGVGAWKPSRMMREAETVTCSVSCAQAGPNRAGAHERSAATLLMVRALVLTRRRCNFLDMPLLIATRVMPALPRFDRDNPPRYRLVGGICSGPLAGCLMSPTVHYC